ncbi:MAG: Unknown protein [uncultured Sulfurovum sp.]|uniref:Uncharacterized protein n=1 Tax=uncultured Sulfurovum sp. TaxID=269237 RepID=A0A6S6UFC0_9BACT|nr:MAG: Unknown protein [uncultured Sulfurovum sp.]
MKNKINLLITLSLPLLILSCSAKPITRSQPTVQAPNQANSHRIPQGNRPNLGQVISSPAPKNERVIPPKTPNPPAPVVRQTPKHGQSYFNTKFKLPNSIKETSGLIKLDGKLWTFNDSGGRATLYQIDERNGRIVKTINISNAKNKDWEDIAYDDNYVYIGDFGNNLGNRRDLRVYKIPRASLRTQKSVRAEVIYFHYNDQKVFTSRSKQHNHDCEAMIAHNGKLYLFSKNWQNKQTSLYELSSQAGKQIAKRISTFNIQGMVTAASINQELDILLLTTYSPLLNVNVWAFTNYHGNNFFNANKKRLNFASPLQGQVEGITFTNNYSAYLSSEAFSKYIFSFDASLYELNFSGEFE